MFNSIFDELKDVKYFKEITLNNLRPVTPQCRVYKKYVFCIRE